MTDYYRRTRKRFSLLGDRDSGWRKPQLGALGATIAHWSLADSTPTLVSIPTGAGKTAVAMAAPFLAPEPPNRVLVVAPARQVREQLVRQFSTNEQLQRIGVLPVTAGAPVVCEMAGRVNDWAALRTFDVVVALPNSVSPSHYGEDAQPPPDLFDLVIIDEAHHAPAQTWLAILDHFGARALLLTATPRRRDGKRIPGSLEYYFPLRRALEEGFYKPISPELLPAPEPNDRANSDNAIAARASALLGSKEHQTSVLLVRAATIDRLSELRELYGGKGIDLVLLHNRLPEAQQRETLEKLRAGTVRAVAVVGMLGEGFDLPSLRLVAYHDKHRSLPATVQLIGRLARADPAFPQPSLLITVADQDVFPELQGVVRQLYDEDADWAEVLPGVIDAEIQREKTDRAFAERFPASPTEVDPTHLEPLKRAIVYEVPFDWDPTFLDHVPEELREGTTLGGGSVLYAGADKEAGLLVVVIRYVDRPKWSSDPALANVGYELHVVAYRKPARTTLPALVLLNLERDGLRKTFEEILKLREIAHPAGPERIGGYLDSLERLSVSSVGVRSTNAATRGRATYRNFLGSGVDRGLRSVDMARTALGHVMFQVSTADGSANAGGAVEKSKLWLTRYGQLRELADWVDETVNLLWFPRQTTQGPLLPGIDRGHRLDDWPDARPLAAELHPALLGLGLELWAGDQLIGGIEDLTLYVNDDPTETLQDIPSAQGGLLRIIGVFNNREDNTELCVWEAESDPQGNITAHQELTVRRGYGTSLPLTDILENHPPTVYFLDGTTTIGPRRYDSRATATTLDLGLLRHDAWPNVDITAETQRTAEERPGNVDSIHKRLSEYLLGLGRLGSHRWILYNHGSGEIADYLVIEELSTGEIHLALWHAKAAHGQTSSVRVKDFQEVVAQALRSRRQFTSTTLWSELAARLQGNARPAAHLINGSDDRALLERRLGITEPEDEEELPWTRRYPTLRGLIGIAQPGLGIEKLTTELAQNPTPDGAASLRELFAVLADTALSDGAELSLLVSE